MQKVFHQKYWTQLPEFNSPKVSTIVCLPRFGGVFYLLRNHLNLQANFCVVNSILPGYDIKASLPFTFDAALCTPIKPHPMECRKKVNLGRFQSGPG